MECILPESFGFCPDTMCPGICPYRDPEMATAEGKAFLMDRGQEDGMRTPHVVHVRLQPEEADIDVPRYKAKNVAMLLATLGFRPSTAIAACGRRLLTHDAPLYPEQRILVRAVMSRG